MERARGSASHLAIEIEDDDPAAYNVGAIVGYDLPPRVSPWRPGPPGNENPEAFEAQVEQEYILIDDDEDAAPAPVAPQEDLLELSEYAHQGLVLKSGLFIELPAGVGHWNLGYIRFMRIVSVLINQQTGTIILRGAGYARTKHLCGLLPRKLNELCAIQEVVTGDDERGLVDFELEENHFFQTREVIHTNATFPTHRFIDSDGVKTAHSEDRGVLCHRWNLKFLYPSSHHMKNGGKPVEWEIRHNGATEADPEWAVPDYVNFIAWRGPKIPGGSHVPNGAPDPAAIDLTVEDDAVPRRQSLRIAPGQQYTMADMFSGAGGASRGAERAGFKVLVAVDHDQNAVESYRQNFTNVYHEDITTFLQRDLSDYKVDILHLSPPCQVFSPAHTVEGQNDDANFAVLFSCADLVGKLKPRLFTLEQTFGILFPRFEPHFHALVQGFTGHGYSVRWKIEYLPEAGLPQKRRRLIMYGSCPGETLPPFAPAAYGPGLKPFVSAAEALTKLRGRTNDPLHNLRTVKQRNCPPWDPNALLRNTITCSGGSNYHWSGRRDFTLRELATFQGFPIWHRFGPTGTKRQIGNAFPPVVVRHHYDHLHKCLLEADGFTPDNMNPHVGHIPDIMFVDEEILEAAEEEVPRRPEYEEAIIVEEYARFPSPIRLGAHRRWIVLDDIREDGNSDGRPSSREQSARSETIFGDVMVIEDEEDNSRPARESTDKSLDGVDYDARSDTSCTIDRYRPNNFIDLT